MAFEVLPTDKYFYDSPDTGMPECLCSRCNKVIPEDDVPIRAWPEPGEYGYDAKAVGGTEFRYCESCLQAAGIYIGKSLDNAQWPDDIPLVNHCPICESRCIIGEDPKCDNKECPFKNPE